ncbi:hypothetical protein EVAR_3540_1 [Eumeta japonica]|uniref:Uncharacterized protein n=1 Tax=Eumeta variegata TaxID=151549 RepID=A0A4C1SW65_EUMVA|nr:hypothetical protein EVAR_3540_1 [Eumeta japonica]
MLDQISRREPKRYSAGEIETSLTLILWSFLSAVRGQPLAHRHIPHSTRLRNSLSGSINKAMYLLYPFLYSGERSKTEMRVITLEPEIFVRNFVSSEIKFNFCPKRASLVFTFNNLCSKPPNCKSRRGVETAREWPDRALR